jgi:polar amino acid transport system permease protein
VINLIADYHQGLVHGFLLTFLIFLCCSAIGVGTGAFLGCASVYNRYISKVCFVLNLVVISSPVVVLLFWFHFPFQYHLQLTIDPLYASIFVISLVNCLAISKIIEHSRSRIPNEFIELANLAEFSIWKRFYLIEMPMIVRTSLPSIITAQIAVLHMSIFASLISVNEFFRTIQRINSIEHSPVELYSLVAVVYIAISLPMHLWSQRIDNKLL